MHKVFIDLDETLIYARPAHRSVPPAESSIRLGSGYDWYDVFVKPGAVDFVKAAQERFGVDNVYMLTAASDDYAALMHQRALSRVFVRRVISRYYVQSSLFTDEKFTSTLYDNMPMFEESPVIEKLAFLSTFGFTKHVEALYFSDTCYSEFTPSNIPLILDQLC